MNDKNLNVNTGRDFVYTITHGSGPIWTLLSIIVVSGLMLGTLWLAGVFDDKPQIPVT